MRPLATIILIASVTVELGIASVHESQSGGAGPAVLGLDHVPIAVRDLEAAAATYRTLGFSLKPGRPHDNGIRNQHVKFADGTELELITAPEARDALTTTYRRHLEQGDGPAFLALFIPDAARIPRELHPSLDYLFFGPRNASPTDKPEHFAHLNTASSLISVWLAGDDLQQERTLFAKLGGTMTKRQVHVPDTAQADVVSFREGNVLLLPGSHQRVKGRPIVGVTLRVKDLGIARAVLRSQGIAVSAEGAGSTSVFVPPDRCHGLWLEFRAQ
jgi:catechol 2,3-dioxygenase-like lactoylglutathione lyase family enzyme